MIFRKLLALLITIAIVFLYATRVQAGDVDELLSDQLETIRAFIVSLSVSFVGTTTFGLIVWRVARGIRDTALAGLRKAEEENRIGIRMSGEIEKRFEAFEKRALEIIVKNGENGERLHEDVENLVTEMRERDRLMANALNELIDDE